MSLTDAISQSGLNVTIEPSSPAMPVDDPEIAEVIDLVTGEVKDTRNFIGALRYGELITERVRIRESLNAKQADARLRAVRHAGLPCCQPPQAVLLPSYP